MHSPWETHPDSQDKLSLQYEVVHYSLYWIAQIHKPNLDNLSTYKGPMTCILYATLNAPKSKRHGLNAQINVNALTR